MFSPPDKTFSKPHELAQARGWLKALRVHGGLPRLDSPAAELDRLEAILEKATVPTARQNIIYLAVLTLPVELTHPWLETLLEGEDREDALVALAFDSDGKARREFLHLARQASAADVHQLRGLLCLEALGEEGTAQARDILRSYRAIEVLDREPYYKVMSQNVRAQPWGSPPEREPDGELLEGWMRRYPGHPGSDDIALRLGLRAREDRRHVDAARWFARSAALPDQDIRLGAIYRLIAICELELTPEELTLIAYDEGLNTPNRDLMLYIRLRRIAAERGFTTAVREAAGFAMAEPLSPIAYAWRGEKPTVPDGDARPVQIDREAHTCREQCGVEALLQPPRETLRLDPDLLLHQFAGWRTSADLELRAATSRREDRAAALYALGAGFYHDSRLLFPVYGWQSQNFRYMFDRAAGEGEALTRFEATTFGCLRAADLFAQVAREHPDWRGLDKALYSRGLALRKALDYPPLRKYDDEATERTRVRGIVEAFEQCAARFPQSDLAGPATMAARWWRRARPEAQ